MANDFDYDDARLDDFEYEGGLAVDDEPVQADTEQDSEPADTVRVRYTRGGTLVVDGERYRRGVVYDVSPDTADALLAIKRGGQPVFVSAD